MRRGPRGRVDLRGPPVFLCSFSRWCVFWWGFLFIYTGQGRFYSILVLIYAALFTLAGVSALMHERVT